LLTPSMRDPAIELLLELFEGRMFRDPIDELRTTF
jgi:hypothetical protein